MAHRFQQLSVIESTGRKSSYLLLERHDEVTDEPLESWAADRLRAGRYARGLYVAERGHVADDWPEDEYDSDVEVVSDGHGTVKVV
ncbi:hypothetical protein ABZ816_31850 [Actinosynnema sp. NPDC047251]|uniref:Uncharacterized protein n=1 Tax=Saccharothrix espanaensis (strain ATCC 51144 / DSM 44229 / JCM 9112 / NBRC 15066 / NRRL 15764) TaxID=1179773 RepID=K0JR41_SACES|nr:hypothetical protein [Saccharothrix espanaensis]CCH30025.1 hypothetical protein BN6_27130 [Saccharothrix espanaensis DSM 44229]